jgi:long-chain acyl-CoA synthetase
MCLRLTENYLRRQFAVGGSLLDALGTFLIQNGLKGKNIAIIGEDSCECAVAYLSVLCGTGAVVPLNEGWQLHQLKRYINAADCSCIIFSETFEDVVWELYNDGVTPLQTFIRMGEEASVTPFTPMNEAIKAGQDFIASGCRDFFNARITRGDSAIIQFDSGVAEVPKPVLLTHGNLSALFTSLVGTARAGEKEVFFSPFPINKSLKRICGLLLSLYNNSPVIREKITARIMALNPNSGGEINGICGRALPGIETKIADADPKTGVGEIRFRGHAVPTAYYNKRDFDTRIYPSPVKDGWYCTGRRGVLDGNGVLRVVG